jgi:hypothetical protein
MRRGLWGAATVVLLLSLPLPARAEASSAARRDQGDERNAVGHA